MAAVSTAPPCSYVIGGVSVQHPDKSARANNKTNQAITREHKKLSVEKKQQQQQQQNKSNKSNRVHQIKIAKKSRP